jgi:hypothetical protein
MSKNVISGTKSDCMANLYPTGVDLTHPASSCPKFVALLSQVALARSEFHPGPTSQLKRVRPTQACA